MPYKRKEDRAAQMRRYRKFKKWQKSELEKALDDGDVPSARRILSTKPSDVEAHVFSLKKPQQKKRRRRK